MTVTLQVVIKNKAMGVRLARWLEAGFQKEDDNEPATESLPNTQAAETTEGEKTVMGMPTLTHPLTRRETEILQLIGAGLPVKTVADRLELSVHTVNQHIRQIYQKLNVHNRVAALNCARKLGL